MSCIRWSPTEKRILREFYPLHGVSGTRKALARAGYERTGDSIVSARKRYGIYKDEPPASPKPVDLSPTRPLTLDSVEMAHWFAQRGFTPEKIAKEINRPWDREGPGPQRSRAHAAGEQFEDSGGQGRVHSADAERAGVSGFARGRGAVRHHPA